MTIQIGISQADYIEGQRDGRRYFEEKHIELEERYSQGSPAYRMGFDSESKADTSGFAS